MVHEREFVSCLRYCKSTIFQANHNGKPSAWWCRGVVCDTAKVRFFKQITTGSPVSHDGRGLFAILQKYDFSSKSQLAAMHASSSFVVCDTAKVRFFKQITTLLVSVYLSLVLFAILQKYDFSSKSQHETTNQYLMHRCLRYCKSTIFQANHNRYMRWARRWPVVCDTAKVRFFKQITTV